MMMNKKALIGVVLAGGKATRMGNIDKPLENLSGKPLIQWSLDALQDQVTYVIISANRNPEKYEYLQRPIIADTSNQYCGPLIGIYSAMLWIEENLTTELPQNLICLPGDVPVFPASLVGQLIGEFTDGNYEVVWAECDGQVQPLFSVWSLACKDILKDAIANGIYGPKLAMPLLKNKLIKVERSSPLDFQNINDRESLKSVQEMINQR